MPKQVVLDQITLCRDGSIGIKWLKQVTDGDEVIFSEPHRTAVDIDGDVMKQIESATVNLASMGYMPPSGEAERMKQLVGQIDAIGKADPVIAAVRAAKIEIRNEAANQEKTP